MQNKYEQGLNRSVNTERQMILVKVPNKCRQLVKKNDKQLISQRRKNNY